MYPCDDTWEFINLALLCVACLLSERKHVSWCDARKCKKGCMHRMFNMPVSSLCEVMLLSAVQQRRGRYPESFGKDWRPWQGLARNTTWEFINLMVTCLSYLSSKSKERLPVRKMASDVIGQSPIEEIG